MKCNLESNFYKKSSGKDPLHLVFRFDSKKKAREAMATAYNAILAGNRGPHSVHVLHDDEIEATIRDDNGEVVECSWRVVNLPQHGERKEHKIS